MTVAEVQAQIGTLREIGNGHEPLTITSRGRAILICLPVADDLSPWATLARALLAQIAAKPGPSLSDAVERVKWWLALPRA